MNKKSQKYTEPSEPSPELHIVISDHVVCSAGRLQGRDNKTIYT